ncbi:unnamed protein product [Gordionus sp. m RMFG-2023]|uniref:TIP41-like protein n=1 Tax=Gordionus sp. m RMFG-2023 TaxID=3053472 RepID=UPI0030DF1AFE
MSSEKFYFNKGWSFESFKNHILSSECRTNCNKCDYCKFMRELKPHLTEIPEMVFPQNKLVIKYNKNDNNLKNLSNYENNLKQNNSTINNFSNVQISFECINALKLIGKSNPDDDLKVSYSKEWLQSREESETQLKGMVKSYDWTFTTSYIGDLLLNLDNTDSYFEKDQTFPQNSESIDYEMLKIPEKILFFDQIDLYEDELGDNGISKCDVKIRVTPSYMFILLRFFLRVDGVIARSKETRYFHQFDTNYILREHSEKEQKLSANDNYDIPSTNILSNIDEVCSKLPVLRMYTEKINIHVSC